MGGHYQKTDLVSFLMDISFVCFFFIEMFDFILNCLVGFFIMRRQVGFLFAERSCIYKHFGWSFNDLLKISVYREMWLLHRGILSVSKETESNRCCNHLHNLYFHDFNKYCINYHNFNHYQNAIIIMIVIIIIIVINVRNYFRYTSLLKK